jgi:hypothetical protein
MHYVVVQRNFDGLSNSHLPDVDVMASNWNGVRHW